MVWRIMCADVGPAHARMQLWEVMGPSDGAPNLAHDRWYQSCLFGDLESLARRFLLDCSFPVPDGEEASVRCSGRYAGAVVHGACVAMCARAAGARGPPGWAADARADLEVALGAVVKRAVLLETFVAEAYGLALCPEADVAPLPDQRAPAPGGARACVACGAALEEALLLPDPSGDAPAYVAVRGDGGRTDFCARTDLEWELRRWLVDRDGAAPVAAVVSGPGLANIYEFLAARRGDGAGEAILAVPPPERPRAVADAAVNDDALALRAATLFLEAFGAELRQVALRGSPSGGLYLVAGGGVLDTLAPLLPLLADAYANGDARAAADLKHLPLLLAKNGDLAILGARCRAMRCLGDKRRKALRTSIPHGATRLIDKSSWAGFFG